MSMDGLRRALDGINAVKESLKKRKKRYDQKKRELER